MNYLGKTVRFKDEFADKLAVRDESCRYKLGTVVDQEVLNDQRALLVVDDSIFGTWKAVSINVEIVSSNQI